MAEEDKDTTAEVPPGSDGKAGGNRLVWLAIVAGVAMAASAAGFGVGRLFVGPADADAAAELPPAETTSAARQEQGEYKYLDFESIVVNLDGPRLDRYVRAAITLAILDSDFAEAEELINKKRPELKNWMTVFFSGCTLTDIRGAEKLNRLRREIRDSLNEQLWPDGQPVIQHVLFKEFAVQ